MTDAHPMLGFAGLVLATVVLLVSIWWQSEPKAKRWHERAREALKRIDPSLLKSMALLLLWYAIILAFAWWRIAR